MLTFTVGIADAMSQSLVFKIHLELLRSSADLQFHESAFQTEGGLKIMMMMMIDNDNYYMYDVVFQAHAR